MPAQTKKEVREIFAKILKMEFIGEVEYKTSSEKNDEEGLYLWSIEIKAGESLIKYTYLREGRHPEGMTKATCIIFESFDASGIPTFGAVVAGHADGEWVFPD